MRTIEKPLNKINEEAIILLSKKIGSVNTFRFINQFFKGNNDYTEQRRKLYMDKTIEEILTEIKNSKTKKSKNHLLKLLKNRFLIGCHSRESGTLLNKQMIPVCTGMTP
jgi:hypothetical protein